MSVARAFFLTSVAALFACSSAKQPGVDANENTNAATEAGSSDSTEAGDASPSPPVEAGIDAPEGFAGAIQSFCQMAAQAVCTTSCSYASVASCRSTIVAGCVARYGVFTDLGAAGRFSIDPASAAACIGAISSDCAFLINPPAPCQRIFAGTVADGQPCLQSNECVSGTCDRGTPATCPGKCAPGGAIGDYCGSLRMAACDPRVYFCEGSKCVAILGDGSPCDSTNQCIVGDYCDSGALGPGVCKPLGAVGAACAGSASCSNGLNCINDTICSAPGRKGDPCDAYRPGSCAGNLLCFNSGFCEDRIAEGGPCEGYGCQEGLVCVIVGVGRDGGLEGTCKKAPPPTIETPPFVEDGQGCTTSGQCASTWCDVYTCARACTLADLK